MTIPAHVAIEIAARRQRAHRLACQWLGVNDGNDNDIREALMDRERSLIKRFNEDTLTEAESDAIKRRIAMVQCLLVDLT